MALSSFFSGLNHKASTGMEASDFGFYCGSSALFAVATKRLHDLDIAGWWLLGFTIVYALLIGYRDQMVDQIATVALAVAMIWLGSAKGTKGSNRFGPDPISMSDAPEGNIT